MSDWKYTFDPISKDSWIKQIESDLKPKGIDSIQSEWWPGEPMFPAHHIEDRKETIHLPDDLFEQPPRVGEWIDTTQWDAKTVNRKLLNSLTYGAQSIIIHLDPGQPMAFRLWLEGVFSEMIELSISSSQENPEIINSIREVIPKSALIRLIRKNTSQPSSVFFEGLQGSIEENLNSFRFIYEIPSGGNWTHQTADIFKLILQDLTYWSSQGYDVTDFLDSCVLFFTPDHQYFKQLIQVRVLHLVWNNFWSLYTKHNYHSSSSYLECHVMENKSVNPDHYLVHASTSALAASLTGVHFLFIHHLDDKVGPAFYSRIDRNINHILNLESDMYKGIDPMAGSYAIDYYTRKWVTDIWEKLK